MKDRRNKLYYGFIFSVMGVVKARFKTFKNLINGKSTFQTGFNGFTFPFGVNC